MTKRTHTPLVSPPFKEPPFIEDDDNQYPPDQDAETKSLAANLAGQEKWRLAESLLWIGLRDLQAVAARLATWDNHLPATASGAIVRAVRRSLEILAADEQSAVFDVAPDETLRRVLRANKVHATGLLRGIDARVIILATEWSDLEFDDGPPDFASDACACTRPLPEVGRFWTALRLDRCEMQDCFPAEKPSWRVGDNETQGYWVYRVDVWAEAKRRAGQEAKLERVYEALETMASESGRTWKTGSLGAARRK